MTAEAEANEKATEKPKEGPYREEGGKPLIRCRGVSKDYEKGGEKLRVLDSLNLDVPEGSFEALMGPSGSGKTTLLNLIAGLDRPSAGTLEIGTSRLDQMSDGALAKSVARSGVCTARRSSSLGASTQKSVARNAGRST